MRFWAAEDLIWFPSNPSCNDFRVVGPTHCRSQTYWDLMRFSIPSPSLDCQFTYIKHKLHFSFTCSHSFIRSLTHPFARPLNHSFVRPHTCSQSIYQALAALTNISDLNGGAGSVHHYPVFILRCFILFIYLFTERVFSNARVCAYVYPSIFRLPSTSIS